MALWAIKRQSQSYYPIYHDQNSLFKVLSMLIWNICLSLHSYCSGTEWPLFITTIVVLSSIATIGSLCLIFKMGKGGKVVSFQIVKQYKSDFYPCFIQCTEIKTESKCCIKCDIYVDHFNENTSGGAMVYWIDNQTLWPWNWNTHFILHTTRGFWMCLYTFYPSYISPAIHYQPKLKETKWNLHRSIDYAPKHPWDSIFWIGITGTHPSILAYSTTLWCITH